MNSIILLITILIFALLLDFLWLGVVSKNFYDKELGKLKSDKVNYIAAILVYVAIALGIFFFVLTQPQVTTPLHALAFGAFFGLILYSVYELTNLALIRNWPLRMVFVDILWGTFLCGITSAFGKWLSGI